MKTKEELEKLNAKRLLSLYKAERVRHYKLVAKHTCKCGCGENKWEVNHELYPDKGIAAQAEIDEGALYLYLIKSLLGNRENVKS